MRRRLRKTASIPVGRPTGSIRRSPARSRRCWRCSIRTATGSSSSKPTRQSRPNTFCCSIISAESSPSFRQGSRNSFAAQQGADGGWPLFHGGALDVSCSVKAYFALKAAGDPTDAPHMARAREAILAHGGARRCNVFTRILLALFGEMPWRAVPVMPVEIMLLPGWSPFHIAKVSYWSRTVLVPLLVLMALRPRARNPHDITIRELFVEPPELGARLDRRPDFLAAGDGFRPARPDAARGRAILSGGTAAAGDR